MDSSIVPKPIISQRLNRALAPFEKFFHWAYGMDLNPTYQSGVLAIFFLLIALVTGVILLFFYRVGSPYESVLGMHNQWWFAGWLRALHRYSSDAAVVAVVVHLLRMLVSGRTYGPRTRAWLSGIGVTLLMLFIGLTGLVMIWDEQAQRLAIAGVQLLDGLPIFSEPPSRIFSSEAQLGTSFFFMLMFMHVALPLVLVFGLIFHTSRLSRAKWLPGAPLAVFYGLWLLLLALMVPAPIGPRADLSRLPASSVLDLWYSFWLPLWETLGRGPSVTFWILGLLILAAVPWFVRTPQDEPRASWVDENHCTGCTSCYQDCPYEAIQMVQRTVRADERHSPLVAKVFSDRCVSCGICAASCAPMGVGPPGRNGREQLQELESLLAQHPLRSGKTVVVLACRWGTGSSQLWHRHPEVRLMPSGCSGSLHTSVFEFLLRRGALGVLVVSCPERDCSHREGPKWLQQRVLEGRDAPLHTRVDRRRIRILEMPAVASAEAIQHALDFAGELQALQLQITDSLSKPEVPECEK